MSTANTVVDTTKKVIKTLMDADIKHIAYIIIIIGVLFMVSWCLSRLNKNEKNCALIADVYKKFPLISTMDISVLTVNNKLRDYYVKTAYNCCSSGNFKNDFVNICALKNCIKQGARCLDFEIYSVDKKPAIATSSTGANYTYKESYNYVDFSSAMSIIDAYAFSSATCPNPGDPLILHFRIMSSITIIHDMIATAIYNSLGNRLLDKNFSYEMRGLNIGAYALTSLMGKVIIIVDKSNTTFYSSKLHEYVNLSSSTPLMRSLRFGDVQFCPDQDELINFNKEQMTIVLPNHSATSKNISSSVAMTRGCQFIGMSFQRFDVNMEFYTKQFDESGHAFIRRPAKYLYEPQFIPIPVPQRKCLSLGSVVTTLGNSNISVSLTSGESCNKDSLSPCHPHVWKVTQIGGTDPLLNGVGYPKFDETVKDRVTMNGHGAGPSKTLGESDSLTFFYNEIKRRASITANMKIPNKGSIGIMIRENLSVNSKCIFISVETDDSTANKGNKNIVLYKRNGSGDPVHVIIGEWLKQDTNTTNGAPQPPIVLSGAAATGPVIGVTMTDTVFLRITRDGTNFTVAWGDTFQKLNDTEYNKTYTMTMDNNAYIGLFVYSVPGNTNTDATVTTTFNNVSAFTSDVKSSVVGAGVMAENLAEGMVMVDDDDE